MHTYEPWGGRKGLGAEKIIRYMRLHALFPFGMNGLGSVCKAGVTIWWYHFGRTSFYWLMMKVLTHALDRGSLQHWHDIYLIQLTLAADAWLEEVFVPR